MSVSRSPRERRARSQGVWRVLEELAEQRRASRFRGRVLLRGAHAGGGGHGAGTVLGCAGGDDGCVLGDVSLLSSSRQLVAEVDGKCGVVVISEQELCGRDRAVTSLPCVPQSN